jgi:hypothetical protein
MTLGWYALLIFGLIVGVFYFCFFASFTQNSKTFENHARLIVLHFDGTIDCQYGANYTIMRNSRIGWFGCWLLLKKVNDDSPSSAFTLKHTLFVYRDSLYSQDYCRLCRHILKATK